MSISWERISPTREHYSGIDARGGRWTTRPPREWTCEISYATGRHEQPYTEIAARMDSIETMSKEWQILHQKTANADLGWAYSLDSARVLIDLLLEPPVILNANGESSSVDEYLRTVFELEPPREWQTDPWSSYCLNLNKGYLTVHVRDTDGNRSIDATYSPKKSRFFHTMMQLLGETPSYDGKITCHSFFPADCDYLLVGAHFIINNLIPFIQQNRIIFPRRKTR